MKVLHVIPSLSKVHGGPSTAIAMMEDALLAQGVHVETAATDDDGPGRRNGKTCGEALTEDGRVRWYFPKRLDFYKPSPAFATWIRQNVRQYDLVHIHALFSFTSTASARAARHAGVPYVIRPLGTLTDYGMKQRRPWLKQASFWLIESTLLRDAAAVHFTSVEEAREARTLGVPMREGIIPLAVEAQAQPAGDRRVSISQGQPFGILFLSRLDRKKNVEGLLEAVSNLRSEGAMLTLTIAGDGDPAYVESLKAKARLLALGDSVRWLGHVELDEKRSAFESADLFALPSHSENFGIAAAEALAHGLPCLLGEGVAISGDVAAALAGVRVRPDAASVTEGLRRMMQSPDELRVMSLNARLLAREQFSMQAMGAALKQLYTDILAR